MPEVTISIGNRDFEVACQEGEEHFLTSAAGMLDAEAQTLLGQIGRMPETRMLLMAGLLLADKTAGADDRVQTLERRLATMQAELEAAQEAARTPRTVEVARVPEGLVDKLAELAARAEAIAETVEETGAADGVAARVPAAGFDATDCGDGRPDTGDAAAFDAGSGPD